MPLFSKDSKLCKYLRDRREEGKFAKLKAVKQARQNYNHKNERLIRRFTDWWETTWLEKLLGDIKYLLENSAFLSIINLLAEITIITSLIAWWIGRVERRENEIFSTWQIVKNASEDQTGVGRIALERLLRSNFSLQGFDLRNMNLYLVDLQDANLRKVNFQDSDLRKANLQHADLRQANLQGAKLFQANLQDAKLFQANLQGSKLFQANLQGADLLEANLQGADLLEANFQDANLRKANLRNAYLFQANFQDVYLGEVTTLTLTPEQIKLACFWEKAIYIGTFDVDTQTWVAVKSDNEEYIKKLKQESESDPKTPFDCTLWDKKSN